MIAPPTLNRSLPRGERFRFPHSLLDLFHTAHPVTIRLAVAASAASWLPTMILAAMQGLDSLKLFLLDFAAQSRLLIVVPLLILTEPLLVARLKMVAHHFVNANLIRKEDVSGFEKKFNAFERSGDSVIARVVMVVLVYVFVAYALVYVRRGQIELPIWCYATSSGGRLITAAYWYVFTAFPLVLYLLLVWMWRQLLWGRLLWSLSRMNLRLVPAHPDLMGGLGFVQIYLRGYLPLGFAIGAIVAGAVGNRVVHLHQPMSAFQHIAIGTIAFVLVLCVGPLFGFFVLLLRTKTHGIFEYGTLGSDLGRQFETKWLGPDREVDSAILDKPDFSATIDLYSVVAYVHQMKFFPVALQYLLELTFVTLIPAVPIALFIVPFDVLLKGAMKLLV